jgi:hypothetical protein
MPISNEQLREVFLTPQMQCYFEKKFPDVLPPELKARIEETLKFLNIATYCEGPIPVSQEIDDIWHAWILETRDYARLCNLIQGQRYIHHSSNVYAQCAGNGESIPKNDLETDVGMLATYVLNYGPFEPDRVRYWVLASHLIEQLGLTVEQLNEWLMSDVGVVTPNR